MAKCSWCGKEEENLKVAKDSYGKVYKVCGRCAAMSKKHKCIKCGKSSDIIIKGLCTNCYQVIAMNRQLNGNEDKTIGFSSEMSQEEFEKWVTMGKSMSPEEIRSNIELKKMWILLKLNLAGIKENDEIHKYFGKAMKMIDRSTEKLIGNKCKLVISNNGSEIDSTKIIDNEEDLYIVSI